MSFIQKIPYNNVELLITSTVLSFFGYIKNPYNNHKIYLLSYWNKKIPQENNYLSLKIKILIPHKDLTLNAHENPLLRDSIYQKIYKP